jgi:cytochrome d ubiquinol oxidase subunit II
VSGLGLPEILAAAVLFALIAYALLAGADFGAGVWDLLASGPRAERQRETIAHAIGPI